MTVSPKPTDGAENRERADRWDSETTYVVGHQRPDTDAIASALGFAWYLNQIGQPATAARAGQPAEQALFALKRFEQPLPRLLADAAPTFGHIAKRQPYVMPESPLPFAMARVAEGDRVVPVVGLDGRPTGVVTALALARAYTAPANVTVILAQACQAIAEPAIVFAEHDRISDHRTTLLRNESDDFLVISDTGQYVGVSTRRRIVEPVRARLFLVDHNELSQAVSHADEAEIVGVLDHHRLGNPPTAMPISFVVEPVGSTSTLVAEHCRAKNLEPPAGLAGLLLGGMLSDTLRFHSPTATDRDRNIAVWLAGLARVDIDSYGEELLRAAPGLGSRSVEVILDTDRKTYQAGEVPISVGQVETVSLEELPERREDLLAAMEDRRQRESLGFIGLMVTDVVRVRSHLLGRGEPWIMKSLPFTRIAEGEYDLESMVSRKKQLIPTLLSILEELR